MEEKLRYCLIGYCSYRDTETGVIGDNFVDLLNQQDKRIKELKSRLETKETINNLYKATVSLRDGDFKDLVYKNNELKQENQQLKEENGYIIFVDGYDNNNNEIHKQEFVKYKDKFKELVEENRQLKQSQKQLAIENCELKKEKLNSDLLFTRLQYIHQQASECKEEKKRFGVIEDMAVDSIWRVFDLQKHECCEYEELLELENGIQSIAEDDLLRSMEHDLQFKPTRTEDEIFEEIQKINDQLVQMQMEEDVDAIQKDG